MGKEAKVIGIDIGGTNFRIGAVDSRGSISHFNKIPVRQVFCSKEPLRDLTDYLKEYIKKLSEESISIQAVSIGFPATLDRDRRCVMQAPNISFMENLPVVEVLSKELGISVFIERDVTMALFYDIKKFELPDAEIISGFYFGTGIGNAIFINGHPLTGKNGTAGELGHIPAEDLDIIFTGDRPEKCVIGAAYYAFSCL